MQNTNAEKLQSVISDDLFPQVNHISDVKQVLEEMKSNAQNLREPQMKALILLNRMGENEYLHGAKNPYKKLVEFVMKGKEFVADPEYYLKTIEALIPKPPKPIVMAEKGERGRK
jgi:ABC-type hemin transport system substrate-binding protein